jgi:hypothetical protein
MARETHAGERDNYYRAQEAAYNTEHWLAWFVAAGAIVLGVLGLLTAFQVVELRDYGADAAAIETPGAGTEDTGVDLGGGQGQAEVGGVGITAQSVTSESFWDGMLLIVTGIAAALLAFCLHFNDHHRLRGPAFMDKSESGLFTLEHGLAYLFALGTIAIGAVALLTGFDAWGAGNNQLDGVLWAFCAVGAAFITTMFHTVRHHETVAEEDYMVRLVEERVGGTVQTSSPGYTGEAARRNR